MQFDPKMLREWFGNILEDHASLGGATEIRIIRPFQPKNEIYSGLWRPRDLDILIRQLTPKEPPRADIHDWPRPGEAQFFWCLNPVDRSKAKGRRIRGFRGPGVPSVRDDETLAYRWIPIDLDPVRPKKTCATDSEKLATKALSEEIATWLRSLGLTFLEADSGNGRHILIPTAPVMGEEAITAAARDVQHLLWYLDDRFTNEAVQVDRVVFNPSRIWKLYGTLAMKGENTEDRPHRIASIDWTAIDWNQKALAGLQGLLDEWRKTPEWKEYEDGQRSKGSGGGGDTPIPAPKKTPRKPRGSGKAEWAEWRREAIDRLNIEDVYGDILTGIVGKGRKLGWAEAQDPWSSSGSSSRSGQVATGEGRAQKGTFHTFRNDTTISVFDYLIAIGRASDEMGAFRIVADLTGVPIPGAKRASIRPPHPADQPDAYGMARPSSPTPLTTPRAINTEDDPEELGANFSCAGEDIEWEEDADLSTEEESLEEEEDFRDAPWYEPWQQLSPEMAEHLADLPELVTLPPGSRAEKLNATLLTLALAFRWDRRPALGVLALALDSDLPTLEKRLREAVTYENRSQLMDPDRHSLNGKFIIEHVSARDTHSTLFAKVGRLLRFDEKVFRGPSGLITAGDEGIALITEKHISGQINGLADMSILTWDKEDSQWRHKSYSALSFSDASLLLHDPVALRAIPKVRNTSGSPLYLRDWTRVATPGYCPRQGGLLYTGPEVEPIKPTEDLKHLKTALGDVQWKSEADLVNYLGACLTAITAPHWWRGHPCLIFNANAPGAGKSTLATLLALLIDGKSPNKLTYTTDDDEMAKHIGALLKQGDRILIIDNAKVRGGNSTIHSALLEKIITDESPSVRLLGKNEIIKRPENDLLVCLTMNSVRLSKDMRRRSLPINLELKGNHHFKGVDPVEYASEHRVGILNELTGMVQAWVDAGKPMPETAPSHSTSNRWAATINAILEHRGWRGFLSNLEESLRTFDPRYAIIHEIIEGVGVQTAARPSSWIGILQLAKVARSLLYDQKGREKAENRVSTTIGKWFADFIDAPFECEDGTFALYQDVVWDSRKREKRAYGIRKLSD